MAVVSQPFDRGAHCPPPGVPDQELGEFWEENPWQIAFRHNLSGFERNRTYLNSGSGFVDISHLTAADSDGDGRAVVADDFNGDGRIDLLVRQAGGAPLRLYENRFPQRHWLRVSLRGAARNSHAVGARVTITCGELTMTRDLFPGNSFYSQSAAAVHFGLGDNDVVDKLTIRWPDGQLQTLSGLAADRHIRVDEESGTIEEITRGQRSRR